MILINNNSIKTLKIKKIKDYEILFGLNGKEYLIHNRAESNNSCLNLYERNRIGIFRHYKLIYLDNSIRYIDDFFIGDNIGIKNFVLYKNSKENVKNLNNVLYKNLDLEHFLYWLTLTFDCIEGGYRNKVNENKQMFKSFEDEKVRITKILKSKINDLNKKQIELFNKN